MKVVPVDDLPTVELGSLKAGTLFRLLETCPGWYYVLRNLRVTRYTEVAAFDGSIHRFERGTPVVPFPNATILPQGLPPFAPLLFAAANAEESLARALASPDCGPDAADWLERLKGQLLLISRALEALED